MFTQFEGTRFDKDFDEEQKKMAGALLYDYHRGQNGKLVRVGQGAHELFLESLLKLGLKIVKDDGGKT